MQYWPHIKTLKGFNGLLGLIGYYKKFVKKYGKHVAPLTSLHKKNVFVWSEVVEHSFSYLKDAMYTSPKLVMLDFTKTFVLECDASGRGLGAILVREGNPLTFTSKLLCD